MYYHRLSLLVMAQEEDESAGAWGVGRGAWGVPIDPQMSLK
jgi:hypothetical protein